jgi:thiamine kinase-like enzyme
MVLKSEASKGNKISIPDYNEDYPLVLTHQDLVPRNIIVGDDPDRTLWVVDWGWAGFYPEWWESLAMSAQAVNEEILWKRKDPTWDNIIPDVCGGYKDMESYLQKIGRSLSWM